MEAPLRLYIGGRVMSQCIDMGMYPNMAISASMKALDQPGVMTVDGLSRVWTRMVRDLR